MRISFLFPILLLMFAWAPLADLSAQLSSPGETANIDPEPLSPGDAPAPDGPLSPKLDLGPGDAPPGGSLPATGTGATDPAPPELVPSNPAALPDSIKSLSDEDRKKFGALLSEAAQFVQGIRIQEAMQRILEAEQMIDDFAPLYNLKGAAFTKVRDFDKATAAFEKCLELDPASLEAKFNLAEMAFVGKKYNVAESKLQAMLDENPRLPAQTRNLILYKVYLCNLLTDQAEAAEKLLASFDYMSDTPEYYFANAAKAFQSKDEEEARSWLQSASRIYPKSLQDLFVDSFVEIGWIETL